MRGDELADRRILRHVALEGAQHPDDRAASGLSEPPDDPAERHEDGRSAIAGTHPQRQRLIEHPMLVAQVVEAEAQMIGDPRIIVRRARRSVAVGDVRIRGGERLDKLQAAFCFVLVRREVNVVPAVGESPEHGFEIAEVREVPPEEEDLHSCLELLSVDGRLPVEHNRDRRLGGLRTSSNQEPLTIG